LNRTEKEALVASLHEGLKGAQAAFLTGFSGLGVEALRVLRQEFQKEGIRYKVVKNTLARRAVQGTAFEDLAEHFVGPTAIAYTDGDPVSSAKILKDFVKKNEKFEIKVGSMEGRTLTADDVNALAALPGRDQLRSMVLAALVGVPQQMVGVLAAVSRDLVGVLDAREKKLAESSESA